VDDRASRGPHAPHEPTVAEAGTLRLTSVETSCQRRRQPSRKTVAARTGGGLAWSRRNAIWLAPLAVMAGLTTAGCTATSDTPASPGNGQPPSSISTPTQEDPGQRGLTAYLEFARISDEAFAEPSSQDWPPRLQAVSQGQAYDAVVAEAKNYASFPAHVSGRPQRQPSVASTSTAPTPSVHIQDCSDIGDSKVVADKTGEVLTDTANQQKRYRYQATVVRSPDGRWRVDSTTAEPDEPC
jgi:hypothetical protein